MSEWQPIETAPRDGSWFMIAVRGEGFDEFEIGAYDAYYHDVFIETENGLYRKERQPLIEWRGFNNFHRATHWMPLPEPPK